MLRKIFVASLSLVIASGWAQQVQVEKYQLANGMTVILHEDHSLPIATINIWYHVGSKDEPDRRSGFAHLFEHLMFMGTKRVPTGQFDKIMEGGGGNNNASTTEDRTNFFSVGPSSLLPTLLWLDADRLEDLGNAMDQHKVDLQRDVVKNERRQNTENTPYGSAYEAINALMFPKGNPYDHSVIGSMSDLDAATVKDVQDFFATYYVPNNASLVVAGDFNTGTIKPMIAKLFGTLPRRNDPVHRTAVLPKLPGIRRLTMVDKVQYPKSIMAWHSPAAYKPGDAEMQLAAAVLSDGLSSRLYQRLVVKDQLATDISAFQGDLQLGSVFYVDATAAAGASQDRMERAIDETLAEFTKTGPTAAELQRAVAKIQTGAVSGLQSLQTLADKLNEYEFYLGHPNAFKEVLSRYELATPAGVRDEARSVLDPNSRLILRVVPQTPAPLATADPRGQRPGAQPERAFAPQSPSIFHLSNGVKVEYWSRPEFPLMAIDTMIRGGSALDPSDKIGRAEMTASMLDEGAGALGAKAFHNALDQLGASFGASSSQLETSASMSVLSSNFDKALSLYSDALLRPRFERDEFRRVQRVTIADLEQANDDPGSVARRVAVREYFGANHPFGRPSEGTPKSIAKLDVNDLSADHKQIFQPQNATIFVAGSLSESAIKANLERAFGKWHGSDPAIGLPATPPPANQHLRVVFVDKPGAVQTVIRFVTRAPTYFTPDREALSSLNTIFGGSFTSRINQNIRETHGYAYGAGSSFSLGPTVGYFVASAAVRSDVTGPSITEFLTEFKRLQTGDISDEEANKAASSRRAEIVGSLDSLSGLLGMAESYEIKGRSFNDLPGDLAVLARLKASDLNAVAKTAIQLDKGVLVLVGDKDTILKQIKGLGLPDPVEVKAP